MINLVISIFICDQKCNFIEYFFHNQLEVNSYCLYLEILLNQAQIFFIYKFLNLFYFLSIYQIRNDEPQLMNDLKNQHMVPS